MRRFFLDTNICLAYIRGHELYKKVESNLNLVSEDSLILISVVTKAELHSLGIQNGWEQKKIQKLDKLLQRLYLIDINESDKELINAYARIDAYSQGKSPNMSLGLSARNMGKNDLWIAASAYISNSELITADRDFEHLHPTWLTIHQFI
ncbi:MAG: type II toxin-antitoxin system VapC family toxin [Bacteroidales bacterium]